MERQRDRIRDKYLERDRTLREWHRGKRMRHRKRTKKRETSGT